MFRRVLWAAVLSGASGTAAMACPDFTIPPQQSYQATGQQLYAPAQFNVVAGGQHALGDCPQIRPGSDVGSGFFPASPDFSFQLSGMQPYRLVVSVVSKCDAALLINTASANWYYDDDDNGNLDPLITLTQPADGRIDIWIGTYDGAYCDATLKLETFDR
ncbi:hypothetical protein [Yoonia vestfoldensis]|uniref:hypothetical protein n=1 Tax=Yoonia vestfoldensis TaxID=245188 RepID=UPI0005B8D7B6|nr:hypothetical protein [Yoonia vestfoldensis]